MFQWKKLGKVFDPTTSESPGWMQEYAQAPSVVIFENHIRIYFSSRAKPDAKGMYVSQLGFIDVDRNDPMKVIRVCDKPIMPLGELGTFDEFGIYPASVIKTEDHFRVYYAGFTRCESVPFNAAIGVAMSDDNGDTFKRLGPGPILSYSPFEPFVLGSPKIRFFDGMWYLWYCAGVKWIKKEGLRPEPVYKIRMATSEDGINWIKEGRDLLESVLEEDECQASADVLYRNGIYHMFYSYRYNLNFREPGRGYRIGYAYSNDLKNWTRDDSRAGITTSDTGWDSDSVSYAHVFAVDEKIYMLYQGNEIGRLGFGLAEFTGDIFK